MADSLNGDDFDETGQKPDRSFADEQLWHEVDSVVRRFEEVWQNGGRPNIDDFLPREDRPSLYRAVLIQLVQVDFERRRKLGETVRWEDYRERYPRLSADPTLILDLTQPDWLTRLPTIPEEIGGYRIEKILGQGGFGIVYLAYDNQLSRHVAIKVPHRYLVARPEDAELYRAEARIVAALNHPNIIPVYHVGSTAEHPFFIVSKLIRGGTLARRIRVFRPSVREATQLVSVVAETLHYAHRQGLVHRDIKPGNILLERPTIVGQPSTPYVADFGLALREKDFGKGEGMVGTPAYMSPEQARGEGNRVNGRSDIFSLGIVFYQMLTGVRPFQADTIDGILEQIKNADVRPPRQRDDSIPPELERICLKALAKRASERYATAKDFADDLRFFLTETAPEDQSRTRSKTRFSSDPPIKIVPKGLRSFEAQDADFFLELLPGPRDRYGLPDSIRFWKTRIEEMDEANTFSVGLIYGPSGSGKSSLVKAGLLPRLNEEVIVVYIEASAEETEVRLLNVLRRRLTREWRDASSPWSGANLPALAQLGLKDTLTALRRGQVFPPGKKVLIVLDQFEQWLHGKASRSRRRPETDSAELIEALRQCDGQHVQCLILVRDDFWLSVSRFLKELEVPLLEGQNCLLVDLFDVEHAKKVLAAFGRAFGRLPQDPRETSKEQKQFLEQAVTELAGEGKVICVRLALFAEWMKSKAWTPGSLKAVGGATGVGAKFLEETFSGPTASPAHLHHRDASKEVLQALLPDSGTNIKGHMKSYQQLLEASRYANRPKKTSFKDFDDLLYVLDKELRLITPADPEGAAQDEMGEIRGDGREGEATLSGAPRFYQLTHDYLVHSLRDWLTREEQATARGRARLLIKDLASLYSARPENRHLPSFLQWGRIRLLTSKKNWTEPQQRLMQKAGRYHAKWALILSMLLLMGTFVGFAVYQASRAAELVQLLETAEIAQVPALVEAIAPYRSWANTRLDEINAKAAPGSRQKLNTSIALLPVQPSQAEYLYTQLLDADLDFGRLLDSRPNVIRVILDFAARYPPHGDYGDRILARMVAEMDERLSPNAEEDAKENLAKRKAKASVALLRMDQSEKVWPLLKHSPDPRVRSYLIHLLGPSGVDFKLIRQQLKEQSDVEIRRALLLSLGEFWEEDIAAEDRDALVNDLCEWYGGHPDPGLHGAVEWLLRKWKRGPWLKDTEEKWAKQRQQREERLGFIKRNLARSGAGQRLPQWYVNSQGQTMVVIPGSVEFMLGSPSTEDGRLPDEHMQQRQRIGHHFAIAAKSVTVYQFQRFLKSHDPQALGRLTKSDYPVTMLSWYEAAEYCNWLSNQEGLQRCYEPNDEGKYEAGMKPARDCLSRDGYRLPTEEEWECACRAGAMTSRYYGESVELLRKYAWYVENSGSRSWDVASLKPNDWGLFDMHGHVFSWCHNTYDAGKTEKHFCRGYSYVDAARDIRAAHRHKSEAEYSSPYLGFRPARTVR